MLTAASVHSADNSATIYASMTVGGAVRRRCAYFVFWVTDVLVTIVSFWMAAWRYYGILGSASAEACKSNFWYIGGYTAVHVGVYRCTKRRGSKIQVTSMMCSYSRVCTRHVSCGVWVLL